VSGLRLVFFLLVFANAAFFAWSQGYLGGADAGREPQRLGAQIAADKLRVVAAGVTAAQPACRRVTGLTPDAAEGLKAALAGHGITVDIKPAEDATRYWVHIPSQPTKAAAEKKAVELRKLGVTDFSIVVEAGSGRHALSLGLFKNEAAAEELLQGLTKRGVKSARIEMREQPPQPARVTVLGPAAAVNQRLPPLLGNLPEAKSADCP
jgi:hypothetical protein